jgi:hypothetical protein
MMQRRAFLGVCLSSSVLGTFATTAFARPRQGGSSGGSSSGSSSDDTTSSSGGWIWSYVATSGTNEESGTIRVSNYVIYKGSKKIGHIDPEGGHKKGDTTVVIFDDLGKLSGKAVLEKSHKKPPVWKGTLKSEDGKEWDLKCKLVEK